MARNGPKIYCIKIIFILYKMVSYNCDRCGFKTIHKHHFLRHLRRKYPCRTKLQDIPIEKIFHNYFEHKYTLENIPNSHKPSQTLTNPHKPSQTLTNPHKFRQIRTNSY